jgi:hypothetical protein
MTESEYVLFKQTELELYPIYSKISNGEMPEVDMIKDVIVKIAGVEKKIQSPDALKYLNSMKLSLTEAISELSQK